MGILKSAFAVQKDANGSTIEKYEGDIVVWEGMEISVGSTGGKAKIISVSGNKITLDKVVYSANSKILKAGEIMIIEEW